MSRLVHFTTGAQEQAFAADDFWRAHYSSKPLRFQEELDDAITLLSSHPEAGELYAKKPPFRRKLLRDTGYYLYYVLDDSRPLIHLVAIWSTRRGSPPPL